MDQRTVIVRGEVGVASDATFVDDELVFVRTGKKGDDIAFVERKQGCREGGIGLGHGELCWW